MKTNLSNHKIIKYLNNELSIQEMKRIESIIHNSDRYKTILNELKNTCSLINDKEYLESNPYLYMEIINKITEKKNNPQQYGSIKKAFGPVIAIILILLTIYTGFNIGKLYSDTETQFISDNINAEFYFNDLQLEKMDNLLLTTE